MLSWEPKPHKTFSILEGCFSAALQMTENSTRLFSSVNGPLYNVSSWPQMCKSWILKTFYVYKMEHYYEMRRCQWENKTPDIFFLIPFYSLSMFALRTTLNH